MGPTRYFLRIGHHSTALRMIAAGCGKATFDRSATRPRPDGRLRPSLAPRRIDACRVFCAALSKYIKTCGTGGRLS